MRKLFVALALASLLAASIQPKAFTTTVTTAGTAVRLTTTNTQTYSATIQALSTNTGTICIGGSDVLAASKNGTCLSAGQAAPLLAVQGQAFDLSGFYIDSTVNGEGVAVTAYANQ